MSEDVLLKSFESIKDLKMSRNTFTIIFSIAGIFENSILPLFRRMEACTLSKGKIFKHLYLFII